ncbi:MAG: FtsX-like permease family protein [Chitinophagaceae bacterium]|nr:FtsX-like permease family protein [Chitinophagaceae bacterium]
MTTYIAWRYLRSKKSANAINIIAWISMVAIGVVTAALVVVLSVFNGFEDLVKQMYGDFYADVKVTANTGKWLSIPAHKLEAVKKITGIKAAEPVIEERCMVLDDQQKSIIWLKGVLPSYAAVSGTAGHMVRGAYNLGDSAAPGMVMGIGVENTLQIIAGQTPFPVTVYLPNPAASANADVAEAMLSGNIVATGSFAVQPEFDEQYAFTHLGFMKYMLETGGEKYTQLEIFAVPNANLYKVKEQVAAIMGPAVRVQDRYEQNQNLFAAMQMEKIIIFAVAGLILIIAGFNIISSLTMTILEKQKDIALLEAFGTTGKRINLIFVKLGLLMAAIGAGSGLVVGLAICLGQQYFKWIKLAGQSFIIQHYPVAVRLSDILILLALVLGIAALSAWLPARRAAKTFYSLR